MWASTCVAGSAAVRPDVKQDEVSAEAEHHEQRARSDDQSEEGMRLWHV